ncbi:MAG: hypothetical protein ACXWKO_01980 [Phenylobacterium sp.]
MVSPVGSASGNSSGAPYAAGAGAPLADTGGQSAATNGPGETTAPSPAVQVSLSLEAELTLTTYQETKITISQTGGGAGKPGASPQDPTSSRALSTLEAIAETEREWIARLKAEAEGKDPNKTQVADTAKTPAKTSADDTGQAGGTLQVSIEQATEVDLSLSVSAKLDVQA